jgi:hypothetical protein
MSKIKLLLILNVIFVSISCMSIPIINSFTEYPAPAYCFINKDAKTGDYIKSTSVDNTTTLIMKIIERNDNQAVVRTELNVIFPTIFGGTLNINIEIIVNNSGKVIKAYSLESSGKKQPIKTEEENDRKLMLTEEVIKLIRNKQLDKNKYDIEYYDSNYIIKTEVGEFDCVMLVEKDTNDDGELIYYANFLNENVLGYTVKVIHLLESEYSQFLSLNKIQIENFQNEDTLIVSEIRK